MSPVLRPLLDADSANQEIDRLNSELEALKAKVMPLSWLTAPAVIKYLENLCPRLTCVVERQNLTATIATLKRLQADPGALTWWQVRVPVGRWIDRVKEEAEDGS